MFESASLPLRKMQHVNIFLGRCVFDPLHVHGVDKERVKKLAWACSPQRVSKETRGNKQLFDLDRITLTSANGFSVSKF